MKRVMAILLATCVLMLTACSSGTSETYPEHEIDSTLPHDSAETTDEVIKETDEALTDGAAEAQPAVTTGDAGLDEKVRKIIKDVTKGKKTEEEKLEAVYMWVARKVRYKAIEVTGDHSESYSDELIAELASVAIDTKKGSCEHIAAVTYVLIKMLDPKYHPIMVDGERLDSKNQVWGDHTWVIMEHDGKTRHYDALYGRNHMGDPMLAFEVTDDVFEGNHTWDTEKYPTCKD